MIYVTYVLIGVCVGIFAGSLGLGGGLLLVPILAFAFGLTQHQAQGTSLAIMIPPITLLATLRYYYNGNVKVGMAIFIAAGFAVGGLIGAHLIQQVPDAILRRVFGAVLLVISLRMIFFK